jgi:hypothetical protein
VCGPRRDRDKTEDEEERPVRPNHAAREDCERRSENEREREREREKMGGIGGEWREWARESVTRELERQSEGI